MKLRTFARSWMWLVCTLFASTASAKNCGDEIVGDFATSPNGAAALRIEKIDGNTVSRTKNEDGAWAAESDPVQVVPQEFLDKLFDGAPWAATSCGLGVAGVGMLLKIPIGTNYQTSSLTERSFVTKQAKSGFLAYAAQGFAVSAVDLYHVRHQGDSPQKKAPNQ